MNALVVYESIWGNTTAVARAIAEGIGDGTRVLSTAEATPDTLSGCDLLVVGSPLLGFSVPNDRMIDGIRGNPTHAGHHTDTSQPPMSAWLETVPAGTARLAAFETRIWWSPGSAAKGIAKALAPLPADRRQGRAVPGQRQLRSAQGRRAGAGPRVGSPARRVGGIGPARSPTA